MIDAVGRDLGPVVGLGNRGQTATIIYDGGLWEISSNYNFPQGVLSPDEGQVYSDSACSVPYVVVGEKMQSMARGWNEDETNPKFWKLTGDSFLMSSRVVYANVSLEVRAPFTYTCTASTESSFTTYFYLNALNVNARLSAVTEVTPPAYTAPFSIVAK